MEEDFRIRIEAILDNSSLNSIKKRLRQEDFDINVSLQNFTETEKSIKSLKQEFRGAIQDMWKGAEPNDVERAADKYFNTLMTKAKQSEREQARLDKMRERSVQSLMQKQEASLNKIATIRSKMVTQRARGNDGQVALLEKELSLERAHYSELKTESSQYKDIIALEDQRIKRKEAAAQAELKVQSAEARSRDLLSQLKDKEQYKVQTGSYTTQLAGLEAGFRKIGRSAAEAQKEVEPAREAYARLVSALETGSLDEFNVAQSKLALNLDLVGNKLKTAQFAAQEYTKYLDSAAKMQLENQIQRWLQQNTAATTKARTEMQGFLETVRNGDVTTEQAKQIRARMGQITNDMRAIGKLGASTFGTLRKDIGKFSQWIGASRLVMKVFQELKEGIQLVKDLDAAMTNINYTMNISSEQLTHIGKSAVGISKELKSATSNVLGAITLYANANETANTILEKTRTAVMLGNVSGATPADAADMLQGVSNQFDIEQTEEGLRHISDVIQNVSQNLAYDFAKGINAINEAVSTAGATANAAGVSFEAFSSMVGKTIEVTRQSGSTVGNAYKTIFSRITKASKTEATSEEDISNAEASLRAVGVAVRQASDPDNFREVTDILSDLGKVWDKLDSVQQSEISYNLAGVRQTNILKSLLSNWSDYEKLVEQTNDAEGTTLQNQEKYAESIKGKMEGLKATGESFWSNILNSGELKFGVDLLTQLIKLLDGISGTLGGIGTVGLGIGTYLGIKNLGRRNAKCCFSSQNYIFDMPRLARSCRLLQSKTQAVMKYITVKWTIWHLDNGCNGKDVMFGRVTPLYWYSPILATEIGS